MIRILKYAVYGLAAIGFLFVLTTAVSYLVYWVGELL